jgi:hypothetical protein
VTPGAEFDRLRPRLKLLLELHGRAESEEERAKIALAFEDVFLATAWNVARDLLDNGYEPVVTTPTRRTMLGALRLVNREDAA